MSTIQDPPDQRTGLLGDGTGAPPEPSDAPQDAAGETQAPSGATDPPETGTGDSGGSQVPIDAATVQVVCKCRSHFFAHPGDNRLVNCPECDQALIVPMANTEAEAEEAEAVRVRELAAAEGWRSEVMEASRACNRAEEKMRAAESVLGSAKGGLKVAEADFGVAVAELRDVIKGKTQPRLPLQPGGPEDDEGASPEEPPALKLDPQHTDEAWLEIHLGELDLSDKQVQTLHDSGLVTIGDVATYCNEGDSLSNIKGIGPAAQKKVEDAIDKHWEEWKHQVGIDRADGVMPEPAEGIVTIDKDGVIEPVRQKGGDAQ